MTTPTATTEVSESKALLQDAFEKMARRSFELSMEALMKVDFYKAVLRKIGYGHSIEDEVPQAIGMSPADVQKVVMQLKQKAMDAANEAWELSASLQGSFHTTVRSALPDGELIPQYDVEYVVRMEAGEAKISVKTWRRNVEVEVVGSDLAAEQLWIAMSMAAMMGV